jgi:hypothetical protein
MEVEVIPKFEENECEANVQHEFKEWTAKDMKQQEDAMRQQDNEAWQAEMEAEKHGHF